MAHALALTLLAAAGLGTALLLLQLAALRRHFRIPAAAPRGRPGVSVLKPLCGVDDDLAANLECFAALDWPDYEVLLGVRGPEDAACPVARRLVARHPGRFRLVFQRGEPGQNPKVNQLITLARAARHPILVVSDSNVRVEPGYLAEIAALLEDPGVGLVTHAIVGVGERRLGSLFDALHLAGSVAPGVVAAQALAGQDIVVGKSMAFRREDLAALGGFEAAKDVLAEDFVLGRRVSQVLGKRVALGHRPIQNVSVGRGVGDFLGRYGRWAVLHRTVTGRLVHLSQACLNPVLLGAAAVAADPGAATLLAFGGVCAAKMAIDGACGRVLRPGGFRLGQLGLVPVKDLVYGLAWARGLVRSSVTWRGTRIRVRAGTRIEAAGLEAGAEALDPAPRAS
ncbi:MAG: glycosyltransferase [Anaeromyxobacter sp.]|nr:glycosyltransferase [Anaeromyxobacter sp.]